ncbi:phage tail protein [Bacillus solitudinis]|uniref:phage tail protein n=1 Tax=Bacillus solitudinis TaxID=2014074 RepID=UPI000C2466EB|nr:tail fiber protein [Bacillus solitudinis]
MDPFVGEIRLFAGNYAPRDWAFCEGQLLAISQNTALFSILGTTYGGDGKTTFALPDLRGRTSMHQGQGTGLTPRVLGAAGGETTVTLNQAEIPSHNHSANSNSTSNQQDTIGAVWASVPSGKGSQPAYTDLSPNTTMNPQALQPTGGNVGHNNMQPYVGLNFIIALYGIYPAHS